MKNEFATKRNLCGKRVRLGRAMVEEPLSQAELAKEMNFLGLEGMTKNIISRIEKGERGVSDIELRYISIALGVSIDWLVGDTDNPKRFDAPK